MKIAVYISDIKPEAGGASSLTKTIKQEILDLKDDKNEYVFIYYGNQESEKKAVIDGFEYLNIIKYNYVPFVQKIKNRITRYLCRPIKDNSLNILAKEEKVDLFWFPEPVTVEIEYPYIYTIWDLGHREVPYFPEVSRSGWNWDSREYTYQKMSYKASYIVTGNETGKREILRNYPMPEDKIRISLFPVAEFCRGKEIKPSFELPKKFFFYPAQFWPHKNQIVILDALVYLREKFGISPVVYLTGSDKGNKEYIKSKVEEYNLENQVVFTGFLKDEELKYLYTHATAMIFASLMGPNNMPPIEATYLNCPVIITDLEGHKEQLKDTAVYFNGYDQNQLAEIMKQFLESGDLRNELQAKQKVLAKEFDSINYFSTIKKIIDEFSHIRKRWGEDYVHL